MVYDITGPYTTKRLLSMSTDYNHVYFSSASASNLGDALLEALAARAPLFVEKHGSANLDGLSLPGADLSKAQLPGCSIRNSDLRGANLTGANLRCDLSNSNLAGARLDSTVLGVLAGTNLRGAHLASARIPPLENTDLRDSNLSGAKFGRWAGRYDDYGISRLDGASVYGATVDLKRFERIDFSQCVGLSDLRIEDEFGNGLAFKAAALDHYRQHDVVGRNVRAILRAQGKI